MLAQSSRAAGLVQSSRSAGFVQNAGLRAQRPGIRGQRSGARAEGSAVRAQAPGKNVPSLCSVNHPASRDSFESSRAVLSVPCFLPYASPASTLKPQARLRLSLRPFPLTPCASRLAPCARETMDNGPLTISCMLSALSLSRLQPTPPI
jgi:hypothetical protein